jgi:hypothetical protein
MVVVLVVVVVLRLLLKRGVLMPVPWWAKVEVRN